MRTTTSGYPRPWYRPVRVWPSAHSYKFVETFSCAQIDLRKAQERELAALDENRRAVGLLNPMRDKNKGKNRGGEGTTLLTTAWPEAGK